MTTHWRFTAGRDLLEIAPHLVRGKTRWRVLFNAENLGSYSTPEKALEDLLGGHLFPASGGRKPATTGVPASLKDWERVA